MAYEMFDYNVFCLAIKLIAAVTSAVPQLGGPAATLGFDGLSLMCPIFL